MLVGDSVFRYAHTCTQLYLNTSAANEFLSLRLLPHSYGKSHDCLELSVRWLAIPYLLLFPFLPLAPSGCVCLNVRLDFSGMIRGAVRSVLHYANPALGVVAISVPPAGKVFTSEKEPIHVYMPALRTTIWTLVSYHFLSTFLLDASVESAKVS